MAKKGQTFSSYTVELKREVVRLKFKEGWSYRQLREQYGIKNDAQIAEWVKKVKNNESLENNRGKWNKKHLNRLRRR